jgi:type III secretory pathway component EscS
MKKILFEFLILSVCAIIAASLIHSFGVDLSTWQSSFVGILIGLLRVKT